MSGAIVVPVVTGPDAEGFYSVAGVDGLFTLATANRVRDQILSGYNAQAAATLAGFFAQPGNVQADLAAVAVGQMVVRTSSGEFGGQAVPAGELPAVRGTVFHFQVHNVADYDPVAGTWTSKVNEPIAVQADDTFDGLTLVLNDRELIRSGVPDSEGIFSVTAAGSGAARWVLTRSAEMQPVGSVVLVAEGTAFKGQSWRRADLVSTDQWQQVDGVAIAIRESNGAYLEIADLPDTGFLVRQGSQIKGVQPAPHLVTTEAGAGTTLGIGAIADGTFVQRVGADLVGVAPPSGGGSIPGVAAVTTYGAVGGVANYTSGVWTSIALDIIDNDAAAFDTVGLALGDRVLISGAPGGGLFAVTAEGEDGVSPWQLTRTTDTVVPGSVVLAGPAGATSANTWQRATSNTLVWEGANPSMSSTGKVTIQHPNDDYTSPSLIINTGSNGQAAVHLKADGAVKGGLRADYTGQMSWFSSGGAHRFYSGGDAGSEVARIGPNGDFIVASGLSGPLADNATQGFLVIKSTANAPTGIPTYAGAGSCPIVVDESGKGIFVYVGGAWQMVPIGKQPIAVALGIAGSDIDIPVQSDTDGGYEFWFRLKASGGDVQPILQPDAATPANSLAIRMGVDTQATLNIGGISNGSTLKGHGTLMCAPGEELGMMVQSINPGGPTAWTIVGKSDAVATFTTLRFHATGGQFDVGSIVWMRYVGNPGM